jgi:hypothetical protein
MNGRQLIEHLDDLLKQTERLYLCFVTDSDRATWRNTLDEIDNARRMIAEYVK